MRELSLFSGAGGGLLGTKLLGWEHCGYVEFNDYCQRVIRQRIKDGILDDAPIFGDIRAFISEGYAASYQGMVDVVTAGFPCQPFSVAGKQQGENDERNMWPETRGVIGIIQPRRILLENVPGLLVSGYFSTILNDLSSMGYDSRWGVLGADDVGAPHRRKRLWIVADMADATELFGHVCDNNGEDCKSKVQQSGDSRCTEDLGNANQTRRTQQLRKIPAEIGQEKPISRIKCASWWEVEPAMGRVVDGFPNRVGELETLGNGQVPAVVRAAWNLLSGHDGD